MIEQNETNWKCFVLRGMIFVGTATVTDCPPATITLHIVCCLVAI